MLNDGPSAGGAAVIQRMRPRTSIIHDQELLGKEEPLVLLLLHCMTGISTREPNHNM